LAYNSQDTCLHCETADTELLHCVVCPFTPSLVFIVFTHGGMARLSQPECQATYRNDFCAGRWSLIRQDWRVRRWSRLESRSCTALLSV